MPATWGQGAELPPMIGSLPRAASVDDLVPLQRLSGRSDAADSGAASPVPMRAITFPAAASAGLPPAPSAGTDAFAGPGLPGPSLAGSLPAAAQAPSRSPARATPAPAVQRSAAAGPGQAPSNRQASEPLALARPAAHAAAPASPTMSAGAPAGSIIASTPAPTVQATPAASSSSAGPASQVPGFTATPVVQRVEGTAPSGADEKAGHSETELDELAKAIFGRIRNHLRTEVIHEREAKGLTFDAF